jgi:hypothetical protein
MGASGILKRQVSRLREEIDGRVNVFFSRTIEGEWPHLWTIPAGSSLRP